MEKRISLASKVNVFLSVAIWVVAGVYLLVWRIDKINDGSYLRCLFAVTYIVCLIVQAVVTAITALSIKLQQ